MFKSRRRMYIVNSPASKKDETKPVLNSSVALDETGQAAGDRMWWLKDEIEKVENGDSCVAGGDSGSSATLKSNKSKKKSHNDSSFFGSVRSFFSLRRRVGGPRLVAFNDHDTTMSETFTLPLAVDHTADDNKGTVKMVRSTMRESPPLTRKGDVRFLFADLQKTLQEEKYEEEQTKKEKEQAAALTYHVDESTDANNNNNNNNSHGLGVGFEESLIDTTEEGVASMGGTSGAGTAQVMHTTVYYHSFHSSV